MNSEHLDPIPLSALQHWCYCPRQCALIHVEQVFEDNLFTQRGQALHQRVDDPGFEIRDGLRVERALPLFSDALGLIGKADVVEFHRDAASGEERAFPVEYKRGRPKAHQADEVQLCAQALCLEVMLGRPVPAGALFYGQTRRRKDVTFDPALRRLTGETIDATRAMFASRQTPTARYEAHRCDACSLLDLCQPQLLGRRSVGDWLLRQLQEDT